MESFKFSEPLPEMILKGKKDITWRINNEKKVLPGDVISLCTNAGKEFAKAKVVWVKETTFRNLSREDFEGHEEFASPEEMYQAYSKWYKMEVTPDTRATIIKFKLALIQLKNK